MLIEDTRVDHDVIFSCSATSSSSSRIHTTIPPLALSPSRRRPLHHHSGRATAPRRSRGAAAVRLKTLVHIKRRVKLKNLPVAFKQIERARRAAKGRVKTAALSIYVGVPAVLHVQSMEGEKVGFRDGVITPMQYTAAGALMYTYPAQQQRIIDTSK